VPALPAARRGCTQPVPTGKTLLQSMFFSDKFFSTFER
jgi:hypothetical protein